MLDLWIFLTSSFPTPGPPRGVTIYRGVQLIKIFSCKQTEEQTNVFQEVLADLNIMKRTIDQVFIKYLPRYFPLTKMERENYISFIVFHNLLPHPISPAGPSSNIILLHWDFHYFWWMLSTSFHISFSDTEKDILRNMLWYLFSFVFYLTPSNHLRPEIRFFFLSFLSKANFPRQTQRQKLPLFTQRAIVVEPAINPLREKIPKN